MGRNRMKDRALANRRIKWVLLIITIVFTALTIRLAYVMMVKGPEYAAMANEQWTSEVRISAKRGRILDRNGEELAVSADVYRIDLDLTSIRKYLDSSSSYNTTSDIAPLIAEAVGMEVDDVQKKLDTKLSNGENAGSAILIRRVEKEVADKVKELKKKTGIVGLIISPDTKRIYTNDNFLAHVLGTTNVDGEGLTGVELVYNKQLAGVPGMKIAESDAASSDLPYTISQYTAPVDGKDLYLTIDANIQYFAEQAAQATYEEQKAKAVSILVMDPKTGEVLAMANKPDFNPNDPYSGYENFEGKTKTDKINKMWRNRLVNDTFEPGSIFKVMTAITAMDGNYLTGNESYYCGGSLNVAGRQIRCANTSGHGAQTFGEIIQNSCNVGFMMLGETIGKENLYESIKKLGFGETCNIDLPGESAGIVKIPDNMSVVDLATIAFGQTNTVNSVQYMAAYNAMANGGTWIQPHVMKEIAHKDEDGVEIVDETFNADKRTVATEKNTAQLREYLEKVVTNGSAGATFIEGYRIGGKTGTAQKVINGVYGQGKYISSFAGMVPVDNPQLTLLVTVDEPGGEYYYASQVAVPTAKVMFEQIFNYYESKFGDNKAIVKNVIIPDVRGLSVTEAQNVLKNNNILCDIEGSGEVVTSSKPYPGYTVKEGTKITLSTDKEKTDGVIMPSMLGYPVEDAKKILDSLGIKYTIVGEGTVSKQSVPSGELITTGTTLTLKLEKSDQKD